MSFFKNRMDAIARPLSGQVAAKLGGAPGRRQAQRALSAVSGMYMEAFAEQMKRATEDARKAAYMRAMAGPSTTQANAERLLRALAL